MALATTCPQCKTSFKVVPDQLKLRRGLVRCGVCQHVFSGIDYLRYVDDAARAAQRQARGAAPVAPGSGTATPAPAIVASASVASDALRPTPAATPAEAQQPSAAPPDAPADTSPSVAVAAASTPAAPRTLPASTDTMPSPQSPAAAPPGTPPSEATATSHDQPPGAEPAEETPAALAPPSAAPMHAPPLAVASAAATIATAPGVPAPAAGGDAPSWLRSPRRSVGDESSAPAAGDTADARQEPHLNWPRTGTGPQTIIDHDDLKTAFFLSDSAFGPAPSDEPELRDPPAGLRAPALPVGLPILPSPTYPQDPVPPIESAALRGPHRDDSTPLPGLLRAEATDRPRPWRAEAGALPGPLRPESSPAALRHDADPFFDMRADPVPDEVVDVAAASPLAPRAARETADISDATAPAIDYFAPRRSRGLGLALSPTAWIAAGVLSLLMVVQALVGWRDAIAARVPQLAPVLSMLSAPFDLQVGPPREIGALTIESFELQSAPGPNLLQLSAVLRNRSGHVVRFPAMELTLTDGAGAVLVRKVIPPESYLSDPKLIDGGLAERSEWPLRLALEHRGLQPTGYSVALFYP